MSIDQRYFRYLDHLGATETVRRLHERAEVRDVVALRHDVDHDLDLALEMAFWEHRRGYRASYYVLHTSPYWHGNRFVDKCRQLQDFGHEVGLHVNVVAEWARGEIEDVDTRLSELLDRLRGGGIDVVGVSSHGDQFCYERGFANYWMFAELRPEDPIAEETGRSAEGVAVDDPRFQIAYPATEALEREDGPTLPLWSSSLADHGLRYHAYHVRSASYLTDSGGSWTRSADPLEIDFSQGRHQVVMHPIYYRGPQRYFLFLSTARSGSKWLTDVLDAGTSVTAQHEFTLNHRYVDAELVAEKRTAAAFRSLMHQPGELRRLVADARTWIEERVTGDWAEANVYLVHAMRQVEHYFWDATLVHLHRHPYDVVRSLLARGWYETPDDEHHPVPDVEGWDGLTQLEKVCHYVRRVNEHLLACRLPRLALEGLSGDWVVLEARLADLGIASFRRLGAPVHGRVANASKRPVSPVDSWTPREQRTLEKICGPIAAGLGYSRGVGLRSRALARLRYRMIGRASPSTEIDGHRPAEPEVLLSSAALSERNVPLHVFGGNAESRDRQELMVRPDGERHTWILLGGGGVDTLNAGEGLPTAAGTFVAGRLRVSLEGVSTEVTPAVFALLFNSDGRLQDRRRLRNLPLTSEEVAFSFKPPPNCARFVLAIYVPRTPDLDAIHVSDLHVEQLSQPLAD